MKFQIIMTWSKIIALLVLIAAVFIDYKNGNATSFMFALPFIVVLVTGKQYIDYKKNE